MSKQKLSLHTFFSTPLKIDHHNFLSLREFLSRLSLLSISWREFVLKYQYVEKRKGSESFYMSYENFIRGVQALCMDPNPRDTLLCPYQEVTWASGPGRTLQADVLDRKRTLVEAEEFKNFFGQPELKRIEKSYTHEELKLAWPLLTKKKDKGSLIKYFGSFECLDAKRKGLIPEEFYSFPTAEHMRMYVKYNAIFRKYSITPRYFATFSPESLSFLRSYNARKGLDEGLLTLEHIRQINTQILEYIFNDRYPLMLQALKDRLILLDDFLLMPEFDPSKLLYLLGIEGIRALKNRDITLQDAHLIPLNTLIVILSSSIYFKKGNFKESGISLEACIGYQVTNRVHKVCECIEELVARTNANARSSSSSFSMHL